MKPPLSPSRIFWFLACWFCLTGLALFVDQPLAEWFHQEQGIGHRFLRPVLTFFDYMGQYSIHILVLAILAASARQWRTMLSEYVTLMVGTTLVCTLLKYAIGRARPGGHQGAFFFHPFSFPGLAMNSFPSGDATLAMALATFLAFHFPKSKWVFWILGVWTALGRVAQGRHFLSDTIFGVGLGMACIWSGQFVIAHIKEHRSMPATTQSDAVTDNTLHGVSNNCA